MIRLLALASLLLASVCAAGTPLAPFSASYVVQRNGKDLGSMRMTLAAAGEGRWQFESHTRGTSGMASLLKVSIQEQSTLRYEQGSYVSEAYRYQQDMLGRHRSRDFQRGADGSIAERDNDKYWRYTASGPVLDRHAVVLAIAEALRDGAVLQGEIALPVVSKGKVESWRFRVAGEESVDTALGALRAVRVERIREDSKRTTVSWHAPQHAYLPVKVEQVEPDGERLVSVLSRMQ
jgi:hypothetical protein